MPNRQRQRRTLSLEEQVTLVVRAALDERTPDDLLQTALMSLLLQLQLLGIFDRIRVLADSLSRALYADEAWEALEDWTAVDGAVDELDEATARLGVQLREARALLTDQLALIAAWRRLYPDGQEE